MTTITASMVKELRDKTGVGMMECKKALAETGGDLEAAVDELRKRGQAVAAKRGGRATSEGLIFTKTGDGVAAMVEMNCETDFVARNDDFRALGQALAGMVHASPEATDTESAGALQCKKSCGSVAECVSNLMGKIGENMAIGRVVRVDTTQMDTPAAVTAYIHPPGKLGVLLTLAADSADVLARPEVEELGRDLAMHVAAAAPTAVAPDAIPAETLEREKNIYAEQAKMTGKPEKIIDKIVEGRVKKYYKQFCLIEQEFVKDTDVSVTQLLERVGKEAGGLPPLEFVELGVDLAEKLMLVSGHEKIVIPVDGQAAAAVGKIDSVGVAGRGLEFQNPLIGPARDPEGTGTVDHRGGREGEFV